MTCGEVHFPSVLPWQKSRSSGKLVISSWHRLRCSIGLGSGLWEAQLGPTSRWRSQLTSVQGLRLYWWRQSSFQVFCTTWPDVTITCYPGLAQWFPYFFWWAPLLAAKNPPRFSAAAGLTAFSEATAQLTTILKFSWPFTNLSYGDYHKLFTVGIRAEILE